MLLLCHLRVADSPLVPVCNSDEGGGCPPERVVEEAFRCSGRAILAQHSITKDDGRCKSARGEACVSQTDDLQEKEKDKSKNPEISFSKQGRVMKLALDDSGCRFRCCCVLPAAYSLHAADGGPSSSSLTYTAPKLRSMSPHSRRIKTVTEVCQC